MANKYFFKEILLFHGNFGPSFQRDPDKFTKIMVELGVDAYRGATQLNLVEPEIDDPPTSAIRLNDPNNNNVLEGFPSPHKHRSDLYPTEAKYMMDHAVYLPVHKLVPYEELDKICKAANLAVYIMNSNSRNVHTSKLNLRSNL